MTFVLDASLALSWCFEDEGGPAALRALDSLTKAEAVVPALWTFEVANGLVVAERRGRLGGADAARAGELLLSLPIVVEPVERSRALHAIRPLAVRYGLSAYDAAYLELAARRSLPLATLDGALAEAAREAGVGVL